ncbi:MAG: SDR family NAD(P)-dependent oxidoreductase [Desulfobacterales bacterium]|nr:SDR family NAD(P)-dependent oxidoreductase [Desulfobacterales bacterium]
MTKKTEKEINSGLSKTPIAIIGVASIFPQSENKEAFWSNIINEVDSITDVPESRWKIDDFYDADPKVPDKTYSKRGGFIPDIDFDPMEFGLPPNILELTDVSQLLSLLVARDVLEDAGYGEKSGFDRDNIGITLGVGGGQKLITPLTTRLQYPVWKRVLLNSGVSESDADVIVEKIKKAYIPWEENSFPGMLGNVIAGRVANRLNLGGTNCVVDAACASSLTAVKMGVSELLEHRSDIIISGGVDTDNSPFMYLCFSKTPAFTASEKSMPFDQESSGIIIGEGVGMVAMKRLSDAERDNDRVYAVIKGIGTSSDGKYKSIYAPRPEGQAKALRRAYKDAGYEAKTVDLVEGHGTGTLAGDIAEFTALKEVFGESSDKKQHIALGSVKSQIGHCKSAAGSAGIIKLAMALHHKVLPPTINVTNPSEKMEITETPFYINSSQRPWLPPEGHPRRGAVSSFGFGGTNFHFTLEEYTKSNDDKFRYHNVANTSVISAEDVEGLLSLLSDLKESLNESNYVSFIEDYAIRDIPNDHARVGFLHSDIVEALNLLGLSIENIEKKKDAEFFNQVKGIFYRKSALSTKGKVVALFSGQGSQYIDMGKELLSNFPPVMDSFSQMNGLFTKDKWEPLTDTVFPIAKFTEIEKKEDLAKLQRTEFAQPAIGSISAGMYKILNNAGFNPDYAVGHSFGELTALWAAGVYSEKDFYNLARERGKAMSAPDDPDFDAGTMLAVMGKVENVKDDIKDFTDVTIANFNSNNQVVLAGPVNSIKNIAEVLKEKKYTVIALPVSAAFHTKLVGHAQKPFAKSVKSVKFNKPKLKVYSNSTSNPYPTDTAKMQELLENHILNPVFFKDQIENIYGDGGDIFIEFGPKNVLTKLVENILKGKPHTAIALNGNLKKDNDTQIREAIVKLCVTGITLKDFDPYGIPKAPPKERGKMSVMLNGCNYVSEKTQQAYIDSLNDGFQVEQVKPVIKEVVKEVIKEVKVEVPVEVERVVIADSIEPEKDQKTCIDDTIKSFYKHQNETVKTHEQYLKNSATYLNTFNELMTHQLEVIKNNPSCSIPEKVHESMESFHNHQNETLRVHNQYLKGQMDSSRKIIDSFGNGSGSDYKLTPSDIEMPLDISERQTFVPEKNIVNKEQMFVPDAVVNETVEIDKKQMFVPGKQVNKSESTVEINETQIFKPESKSGKTVQKVETSKNVKPINIDLTKSLLEIVSEKTGYPAEMLELDMDMEGDLGIDSIKRVEILSAIMEKHPELPNPDADTMSELKTLKQVMELLDSNQVHNDTENVTTVVSTQTSGGVAELESVMMKAVSEKTGYPEEMLELEMDMEGDLGIDSIKRVEIMSAVMEMLPNLPQVNPDDLAVLKTLKEIVEIFAKDMGETANVENTTSDVEIKKVSIETDRFSDAMLEVVSEKTGYPKEMLELDMDMEGDLGIDSIKRVEIMSAVMEKFPELPQVNPDDLAVLKTLGEIVDAFSIDQSPKKQPVNKVQASSSNVSTSKLTDTMLNTVSEKTGYPKEMLELDMDMEGDLGIDSIKRVEIMSAVMDSFPELPQVNPDDLATLKTLGQIIEVFAEKMGPVNQITVTEEKAPSIEKSSSSVSVSKLTDTMLNTVSDKTGYPKEMLELDMDMEGDLGIDSIKRVEIMSAVMESFPELPQVNPDDLAALKTLGQIIEVFAENMEPVENANNDVEVKSTIKTESTSSVTVSKLTDTMLNTVSDKTGYPKEMLELDMDMEGDLGIDSIKRVEIMSAVMESFPELPQVNPDDLAALKTLGQIIDVFAENMGPVESNVNDIKIKSTPKPEKSSSVSELTDTMLSTVSEKTGYPKEMLELDMDMEGDLGIDSIKRVEIMSAVMESFPDLPQVNPDDLAALKTLGQIIEVFANNIDTDKETKTDTPKTESSISESDLTDQMLDTVSEKTGYPKEMLELDMDMEGDLGIDSIKRVEIMSAVMDKFPELPQVNPDELATLKTLGQIINVMVKAKGDVGKDVQKQQEQITDIEKTTVKIAKITIIPEPDYLEYDVPEGRSCLIIDDGSKVTSKLTATLHKKGFNPVVLSFPEVVIEKREKLSKDVKRYSLKDLSEDTLSSLIAEIVEKEGAPCGIIHVDPVYSVNNTKEVYFSKDSFKILKTVFLTAKHLKKYLCDDKAVRNFFITVSRMDGYLGLGKKKTNVISGGLAGLTKTLNLEWADTFCRAVDIDPNMGVDKTVEKIVAEIHDPDRRVVETAYFKKQRITLFAGNSDDKKSLTKSVNSSSVLLVSGGAKGVTAKCVVNLAKRSGATFILLGRSKYDSSEPGFLNGVVDEPQMKKAIMEAIIAKGEKPTPIKVNEVLYPVLANREITETMDLIKEAGGKCFYVSCDVTDEKTMKKKVGEVVKEAGDITGIIHGAGVLADRFIEDKTEDDFNSVLNTKIDGLKALFSSVDSKKITHLSLFSSAAGFYGNEGQADYSIANEILNKTAHSFKRMFPSVRVNSFNWGPWDGGMVTPELKRMFEEKNVQVIPLDEGTDIFSENLLSKENDIQVLVGSSMLYEGQEVSQDLKSYVVKRKLFVEDNSFLEDHMIGGNKVLPTVCATSWMADACEKLYPGYKFIRCNDYKLFKGIVFDGNESNDYTLDIKESSKTNGNIDFSVLISSNGSKKKVNHYGAQITITGKKVETPIYDNFNKDETDKTSGTAYYEDGTLFHGPDFQAAGEILNMSKEKLTMLCKTPDVNPERMGQFPIGTFNPYAADVQFQSMLIWVRKYFEAGSLPSSAKTGEQFEAIPEGKNFYVSLDIKNSSDSSMVADITSHDVDGKIYTRVLGAKVTISKQLNNLFQKANG